MCTIRGSRSAKAELRANIKCILSAMSEQSKIQQSQLIFNKLINLDCYKNSSRVGVYLNMAEEVQTDKIVKDLLQSGKLCFIPWYNRSAMKLVQLESLEDLASLPLTKWNIRQPAASDIHLRKDALLSGLDVVIVPGLAFTKDGHRLGRGKGYYDKFLRCLIQSGKEKGWKVPKTVGVTFREQVLESIPYNEHDFKLDLIITSN